MGTSREGNATVGRLSAGRGAETVEGAAGNWKAAARGAEYAMAKLSRLSPASQKRTAVRRKPIRLSASVLATAVEDAVPPPRFSLKRPPQTAWPPGHCSILSFGLGESIGRSAHCGGPSATPLQQIITLLWAGAA